MYYETEEPLDFDVDSLAFKIGANVSDVHQIIKHFFFEHEGRLHHSRCDLEILAFREKSTKAKKSATARWENALAMRTHCDRIANARVSDANQEPITNNQEPVVKPLRRKSAPIPAGFQINEVSTTYAQDRNLNIADELVAFANWHTAKGSTFKDWQAAWRTWCDKAVEFGRARGGAPPNSRDAGRTIAANSIFKDEHLPKAKQDERTIDAECTRLE